MNGVRESDYSDNFAAAEDQSELEKSCQGRMFVMQNQRGWHFYIGSNTTENYKPHPDSIWLVNQGNQNAGEQVLFENTRPLGVYDVVSATSNTVEVAEFSEIDTDYYGMATIVAGKGYGQTRPFGTFSGSDTVSVLEPWTIVPDSTSDICPHLTGWRGAVVANYFDGIPNNQDTASAAVSMYGGPNEVIVADNVANEVEDGFILWSYSSENVDNDYHPNFAFWNVFENNHNQDPRDHPGNGGGYGYYVNIIGDPSFYTPTHATMGNIFRDNTVSNATVALAVYGTESTYDTTMTTFEFNSGSATNGWGDQGDGLHTYTNNNSFTVLQ